MLTRTIMYFVHSGSYINIIQRLGISSLLIKGILHVFVHMHVDRAQTPEKESPHFVVCVGSCVWAHTSPQDAFACLDFAGDASHRRSINLGDEASVLQQ
jgi:hypothetical protein